MGKEEDEHKRKKREKEFKEKEAEQNKKLDEIHRCCMDAGNGGISFEPSLSLDQKVYLMTCNCGHLFTLYNIRKDVIIFRCRNFECRCERALPRDHSQFIIKQN